LINFNSKHLKGWTQERKMDEHTHEHEQHDEKSKLHIT